MILEKQRMALLWVKRLNWMKKEEVIFEAISHQFSFRVSSSSSRSRGSRQPRFSFPSHRNDPAVAVGLRSGSKNWLFSSQKRPQVVTIMICFLGAGQRKTEFRPGSGQFFARSSRADLCVRLVQVNVSWLKNCGSVAQSVERPKGPSLVHLYSTWSGLDSRRRGIRW